MKTLKCMAVAMMGVGVLSSCSNKDNQLSSDAKIESFTFDTSVEANQIVRSQPELSGMAYSFVVYPWADGEAMAALVPTIVVSQGATYTSSGSYGDNGLTYVVTAEDKETSNTYTVAAKGSIYDTYAGLLDVSMSGDDLVTDVPYDIVLKKGTPSKSVSVFIQNFQLEILGATVNLGDIQISDCPIELTDAGCKFSGELDLGNITVPVGAQQITVPCVVNAVDATVDIAGNFELPLSITVAGIMTVDAHFTGAIKQ